MKKENYESVNHPNHYGGKDAKHEVISVIEEWDLNFCLGNAVKYIARAGRKPGADKIQDLNKALWYIKREIQKETNN